MLTWIGCTLRSWLHEIPALIIKLSPRLEKNYTLERSSKSFPGITNMSGCLENFQKYIPKSVVLQSRGQYPFSCLSTGPICPLVFTHVRILSPGLENNGSLKVISNSFPGTLTYLLFLENCWNSTPMCSFSPIQQTKS